MDMSDPYADAFYTLLDQYFDDYLEALEAARQFIAKYPKRLYICRDADYLFYVTDVPDGQEIDFIGSNHGGS